MRFKRVLLVCLAAISLSACGERAPESSFAIADQGCLNGAASTFNAYFEGKVSERELTGFWDCLDHALKLFSERVRYSDASSFRPDELRTFLYTYFMDPQRFGVSDALLNQAMQIKSALVGGSATKLTKDEIGRTRALLGDLKLHTLRLRSLMPLTPSRYETASAEEVDRATEAFVESATAFGRSIERGSEPYSLRNLETLTNELHQFLPPELVTTIRQRMPLILELKAFLIKPDAEVIAPDEWPVVLSVQAKAYGLYLKGLHWQRNYSDWRRGAGRDRLVELGRETIDLLQDAAARHPNEAIPFAAINRVIDLSDMQSRVAQANIGLTDLVNVKKTLPAIVRRFLSGGRDAGGLTPKSLAFFRQALDRWAEGQQAIESIDRGRTPEEGIQGVTPGLVKFFQATPSLFEDSLLVNIPATRPFGAHSFEDMSQLLWMREISRAIVLGYAADPERGVTVQELREVYEDVRDLGIQLKAFDPFDKHVPEKRFFESNLFLYASDGDKYLDIPELTELFAFALSARVEGDRLQQDLADNCYKPGEPYKLDIYGKPSIEPDCFKRVFYSKLGDYMPNLPDSVKYYNSLPAKQKHDYETYLEAGAKKSLPGDWITSGDTQSMDMYTMYVEALFWRYDTNHDGSLDYEEALRAFPTFKAVLADVQCTQDEALLRSAFLYLMKHGGPPAGWLDKLKNGIPWIIGEKLGVKPKIAADRVQILKIFAEFTKATTGQVTCPAAAPVTE